MTRTTWSRAWLLDAGRTIDEPQVWRGVETQHISATMLLVDTGDEHDLLEALLDAVKPPLPVSPGIRKHYLLTTPFRYTPEHASRFRPAGHLGIWYGSLQLRAACAEAAYWRMIFILDSAGLRDAKITGEFTFFSAHVSGRGVDLTAPPWDAARATWTNGQDYAQTHRLSLAAEAAGIQVIQYESVRSSGDLNLAVFTPNALKEPQGGLDASQQTWRYSATKDHVWMRSVRNPSQKFEWVR